MKKRPIYAIYLNKAEEEFVSQLQLIFKKYGLEIQEKGVLVRALMKKGIEEALKTEDETQLIEDLLRFIRVDKIKINPDSDNLREIAEKLITKMEVEK